MCLNEFQRVPDSSRVFPKVSENYKGFYSFSEFQRVSEFQWILEGFYRVSERFNDFTHSKRSIVLTHSRDVRFVFLQKNTPYFSVKSKTDIILTTLKG